MSVYAAEVDKYPSPEEAEETIPVEDRPRMKYYGKRRLQQEESVVHLYSDQDQQFIDNQGWLPVE
jgi:hypothetical protein